MGNKIVNSVNRNLKKHRPQPLLFRVLDPPRSDPHHPTTILQACRFEIFKQFQIILMIVRIFGKKGLMNFNFRDFLRNDIWRINIWISNFREIGIWNFGFRIIVEYPIAMMDWEFVRSWVLYYTILFIVFFFCKNPI